MYIARTLIIGHRTKFILNGIYLVHYKLCKRSYKHEQIRVDFSPYPFYSSTTKKVVERQDLNVTERLRKI